MTPAGFSELATGFINMPKFNKISDVWLKVEVKGDDECWPWIGKHRTKNGYGKMDIEKVEGVPAHRIAYLSANPGSITLRMTQGINVLHRCDNPPCCNPNHLFLGTHLDNMRDKKEKGRLPDFKGVKGPNAKLNDEEVKEIRKGLSYGLSTGELAKLFNVSKPAIKDIKSGRSYVAH